MFSKSCEYAIKSVIFIAAQSANGNKVSIQDIAKESDSPLAFTSKILQKLTKANLLESNKGPNGGYYLSEADARKVSIYDIVCAIDGANFFDGCALGLDNCSSEKPCPAHNELFPVRQKLKLVLINNTVFNMSQNYKKGNTFLMN